MIKLRDDMNARTEHEKELIQRELVWKNEKDNLFEEIDCLRKELER